MLNRVILIGRLTRDPDLKYTPSGVATASFTLAVDRPFTSGNGEREADFIPIITWRQLAENCANYLRKGRLAAVEGRINVRNYENNEGRRIYVTEIIADNVRFLESNRESGAPQQGNGGGYSSGGGGNVSSPDPSYGGGNRTGSSDPYKDDGRPIDINPDDLPF